MHIRLCRAPRKSQDTKSSLTFVSLWLPQTVAEGARFDLLRRARRVPKVGWGLRLGGRGQKNEDCRDPPLALTHKKITHGGWSFRVGRIRAQKIAATRTHLQQSCQRFFSSKWAKFITFARSSAAWCYRQKSLKDTHKYKQREWNVWR